MELLNLNQGEKVLVAHIVGERIVEVAELVERNKHGKIYKLKKDATVLVENPSKHDEGHFVVKHLRDAVEGHEVYEVPVIKDKLLRRSCDQHGLTPVHVPGGEYPLVSSPSAVIIPDYNMSGSRHYVVDGETKRKVFDFAYRILQSRIKEDEDAELKRMIKEACLYQQNIELDLLANTIYKQQLYHGQSFGTGFSKECKETLKKEVNRISSFIASQLIPRHLKRGYEGIFKLFVDEPNKFIYWTEN